MVTDSDDSFLGYHFSKGETCDYIAPGADSDCGEPATFIIMAAPPLSDAKPFYACPEHGNMLESDLRRLGWDVRPVQPL